MKVYCDEYNKDQILFLKNIEIVNLIDNKIELHFDKDEIYLINNNYKDPVKIIIDFNEKKFVEKNNIRLKNNHDIFQKIFSIKNSTILDGTAGFGRDGYLLASMNHDVTMIDNSPIVSLLLKNALKRSGNKSIKLFYGNTYDFLRHSVKKYNYIYLDFMFNKLKNSSLSSKNDETLKLISFIENDKNKIIQIAQKQAMNRVVVKEPVNSSSVLSKPNHIIKTKLISYNIYLGSDA